MQYIPPFPDIIDRDYFGAWLSGFTDGEGCFRLYLNGTTKTPAAKFVISLRKDDQVVLLLIQAYLSCGCVDFNKRPLPSKPQMLFRVDKISDLMTIVVPHFDRFHMFAKKSTDFEIWKRGVEIIHKVNRLRVRRWSEKDRQQFYAVQDELCEHRRYKLS